MNPHGRMGSDIAILPSVLENGHVRMIDFLDRSSKYLDAIKRRYTVSVRHHISASFLFVCVCLLVNAITHI
jgi:hypothetical protein